MFGMNNIDHQLQIQMYLNLNVSKCIRNWPLPIGAFQDQCKQIVINEHNLVKNPNWRKADQLAISVDEKLNSGLPRTTSASDQNGI